ncbi:MAG: VCBS repeat-containing protein, partial [Verrucomicrobiota bacterium]
MRNCTKPLGLVFVMLTLTGSQAAPTSEARAVHLVSRIVGKNFLSETIRIGDLNGDGAPDILFVQNVYGPRTITCLTATTLAGEILWQTGTPSKDNGRAYCDLPVQIYDWDRDGTNDVLYVRQATYLDSPPPTGQEHPRTRAALRRQRHHARAGLPHGKRENPFCAARAGG